MSLLTVRDLQISYDTSDIFREPMSFVMDPGESVALIGDSGSGKTSLVLALLGLLPPYASVRGQIMFDGIDLVKATNSIWKDIRGRRIALISQDPSGWLDPVWRVDDQIAESVGAHHKVSKSQAKREAHALLQRVGIPDEAVRRYPHQLSGGMCQRVAIASAIANSPDLLIADEPTSALDALVQREILDLLRLLQREHGVGLFVISHDREVVSYVCDRSVQVGEPAPEVATHQRRYANKSGDSSSDLLVVSEVSKSFGKKKAVENVDLTIRRGETLGLVGGSGSGKSTLARLVLGLIRADEGSIAFGESVVDPRHPRLMRDLRRKMQFVAQNPYGALDPRMSVADAISEPLRVHGIAMGDRVERVIGEVGLEVDVLHARPHELSGGQRQRVAIARALVVDPEFLVLDEPVSSLDQSLRHDVLNLLAELQHERGLTYLLISHDFMSVRLLATNVAVMRSGALIESGSTYQVLESPQHAYTRQLVTAQLPPVS